MELNENYLLDELFSSRREMNWELAMPTEMNGWNLDCPDSSFAAFSLPIIDQLNFDYDVLGEQGQFSLFGDQITAAAPITNMEEEELGILEDEIHNLQVQASCKIEPTVHSPKKIVNSSRKVSVWGQPSKNLMAERRRRKRLNDRLSMLRSIVPKITKMDRTAILADAIDYVKELMEKINNLQREEIEVGDNPSMGILRKNVEPNEYLVRNSLKFKVERREIMESRIEIKCVGKPELLMSTVQTLEDLGLHIQQCVISCFNDDFSIQASCSEGREHRTIMSTEEVKQALFENAGYGGRCIYNNNPISNYAEENRTK